MSQIISSVYTCHFISQISFFIFVIFSFYTREAVGSEWLLEKSYYSKPIYSLKNDVNLHDNNLCRRQLFLLLNRPSETSWGYSMLDANAGTPSGLLNDQFTSVGDYKECLAIEHEQTSRDDHHQIKGKYCFLTFTQSNHTVGDDEPINKWIQHTITVNTRFPYAYGICVPEACSKQELIELFNNSKEFQATKFKNINVQYCQVDDHEETFVDMLRRRNTLVAFPILCIAIILAFLGTLYEVCVPSGRAWLLNFSIIKNSKAVFVSHDNRKGSLQQRLSHIHGIRAFAMLWILWGHNSAYFPGSIVMPLSQVARHPHDFSHLVNASLWSNLLNNAYHAVQTFFFLSGFLLLAVMIDKKFVNRATFASFWGLRYVRFVVPMLGIIVIHKCMFMLGDGPFNSAEYFYSTYPACKDTYWWKQLLFYNNLVAPSESCIYFSWFLSADLQIHILAFLLIVALRNHFQRLFYFLCLFFGSFTLVIPFALIVYGIPTFDALQFFVDFGAQLPISSQIFLYSATYMHMAAFFYGCAIGLALMSDRKLFFARSPLWWYLSLANLLFTAFVTIPSLQTLGGSHIIRGSIIAIVYSSWVVALSIIIYQMSQENLPSHVTFVRNFLSMSPIRPISRLSFSIYLSQLTISHINFVLNDDVHLAHQAQMVRYVFSTTMQTLILGFVLFLLFECPVNNFIRKGFENKPKLPEKLRMNDDMNSVPMIEANNNHNIKIDSAE